MTIWKYQLPIADICRIDMPEGARVLHVDEQAGQPCLWALVDPAMPLQARTFRVAGTGHPIEVDGLSYIGTFQMIGGALVWHVFEIVAPRTAGVAI